MDNISIKRIATLHPKLIKEAGDILIECEKVSVGIRITSAFRTPEEQNALYAIGRTKPGRVVTNAQKWQSFHNYGLAVDICLYHKDGSISYSLTEDLDLDGQSDWMEVVKIFKAKGWEWAGDWKIFRETPHFQKSFNWTYQGLFKLKQGNKVDSKGFVIL